MKNNRRPNAGFKRTRTHIYQPSQAPKVMEIPCETPEQAAEAQRIVDEFCKANGLDATITVHKVQ